MTHRPLYYSLPRPRLTASQVCAALALGFLVSAVLVFAAWCISAAGGGK